MSLLTPERVPVKVYKWDDVGAPVLDKTAGCMMTIFKACLVTGYGTKAGAGWTMPYEDTAAKIKVFRPEVGPHKDFYLKLSADTGTQMAAQAYLDMTDANTGNLKLQCATPFKYAKVNSTGKWLLVASPRGVWFFCEQRVNATAEYGIASNTGAFFFIGDSVAAVDGSEILYLHHSGGTTDNGSYSSLIGFRDGVLTDNAALALSPQVLLDDNTVLSIKLHQRWVFDGFNAYTNDLHTMQLPIFCNKKMYLIPGVYLPSNGAARSNFDVLPINQSAELSQAIVFGSGGEGPNNTYVAIDYWSY